MQRNSLKFIFLPEPSRKIITQPLLVSLNSFMNSQNPSVKTLKKLTQSIGNIFLMYIQWLFFVRDEPLKAILILVIMIPQQDKRCNIQMRSYYNDYSSLLGYRPHFGYIFVIYSPQFSNF